MKIIVGLGNPGKEYEDTRHNVGFMLVDKVACSGWRKSKSGLLKYSWLGSDVELVKPQQFMNRSGEAIKYAMGKHKISLSDLLVIHDDLDLPLGEYKLALSKGPKIHNGVNSVNESLSSTEYFRLRIGIDSRDEEQRKIPGSSYVLGKFSLKEKVILEEVFVEMRKEIEEWCV